MEKYNCLVCGKEMIANHMIAYIDYHCQPDDFNHHFSWRIKNNILIKLRVRFSDKKERLCLKIHYDEGYSEVWSRGSLDNRLRIDQIIFPNFEDIEKLKNKIKTILVFG